jgi:pimeloyl-ACP methyl ester carboxylesterase
MHGALGTSSQFDSLIPLIEHRFNVFRFDFIGHGSNQEEHEFTMNMFANQLRDFIKENNLQRPAVFGYSLGGYVSYTLSLKEPDSLGTIMSIGSKLKWNPEEARKEIPLINAEIIKLKVPKYAAYLDSLHGEQWPSIMDKLARMIYGLGNGNAITLKEFSTINNKCFVGVGEHDEMVTHEETQEVADTIPNGQFFILKNSKHGMQTIDMKLIAECILNKLD